MDAILEELNLVQPNIKDVFLSVVKSKASIIKFIGLVIYLTFLILLGMDALFYLPLYGIAFTYAGICIGLIFLMWLWQTVKQDIFTALLNQLVKHIPGSTYYKDWHYQNKTSKLFTIGHSYRVLRCLVGELNEHVLEIFLLKFTTGHGKQARGHTYSVLELGVKSDLPKAMLLHDSMGNEHYIAGGSLTRQNLGNTEHEYEFTLYTEKGMDIEAFQIFNHEFLESLKEWDSNFHIELAGKSIFIFIPGVITKASVLKSMFKLANKIILELIPRLSPISSSVRAVRETYLPK